MYPLEVANLGIQRIAILPDVDPLKSTGSIFPTMDLGGATQAIPVPTTTLPLSAVDKYEKSRPGSSSAIFICSLTISQSNALQVYLIDISTTNNDDITRNTLHIIIFPLVQMAYDCSKRRLQHRIDGCSLGSDALLDIFDFECKANADKRIYII